jgi:argininosuccinate synthase
MNTTKKQQMNTKNKVLLAFSGGLDTTFCAVYLQHDLQLEVHSVFVNTGAFSTNEVAAIEQKAHSLNVASHTTLDVSETYYNEGIKFLLFGNVLKNDTYPLSVSSERVFQAKAIAELAKQLDVHYIAHGSTGAGNDQVRFDMVFQALVPKIEILTPIRDLALSRNDEIRYLHERNIFVSAEKAQYSINEGLWGTSIGGAETLTSHLTLPEKVWPYALEKTTPEEITIEFVKGEPVALNSSSLAPIELIKQLDALAQPFGIGRDVHVGDTIIGIKGRVAFVAAAPLILIKAHQLLEKHTLTKWQQQLKKQQSEWYGALFHEGQFMDPVMRDIEAHFQQSQERVSGTITVQLAPYHFNLIGITSEFDLLNSSIAAYGEGTTAWSANDAKGFITINGMQTKLWYAKTELA